MKNVWPAGLALVFLLSGNPVESATLRVADFGARGDGSTNDASALQRAFNALKSGDELHFDASKVYLISQSLSIRHKSGYTVVGNGATIKASSALPADKYKNSYILYILQNRDFTWKNLTFDGNKANRSGPAPESGHQGWLHNVIISGGSNFVFDGVRSVQSYGDGFYLQGTNQKDPNTYPRGGKFLHSEAEHNWRNGLTFINARDMWVYGGSYSHSEGDWPMAGIQLESNYGSAEPGIDQVLIERAHIVGNKGHGVGLAGKGKARNITVESSYFSDNARGGAGIYAGNVTIQNSVFEFFTRQITYRAYGGTLGTVTRGVIDIGAAAGNNYNFRVLNNTFREIHINPSAIFVHSLAGSGGEIRGNCFESLSVPDMRVGKSGTAVSGNTSGGCPSNSQRLGW